MKGTKILLVVSGLFALGIGLAMNIAPQAFLGSQGLLVDDKISVLAQAQGALLAAIGVTNFLGLRVKDPVGLQAILGGNIAAHVFGLVVNFRALSAHTVNSSVIGDVVGHVIFGLAFIACLLVLRRKGAVAAA
jgi:hypothetical protein